MNPRKIAYDFEDFWQSVKISPNLVTLLVCNNVVQISNNFEVTMKLWLGVNFDCINLLSFAHIFPDFWLLHSGSFFEKFK